mmetsp:Transcript_27964/g.89247  ORF Transcript_27964/g.89247 Transcript_27964/m.89247 type:complete len:235 (-) Transcript_27964:1596-2300(-)
MSSRCMWTSGCTGVTAWTCACPWRAGRGGRGSSSWRPCTRTPCDWRPPRRPRFWASNPRWRGAQRGSWTSTAWCSSSASAPPGSRSRPARWRRWHLASTSSPAAATSCPTTTSPSCTAPPRCPTRSSQRARRERGRCPRRRQPTRTSSLSTRWSSPRRSRGCRRALTARAPSLTPRRRTTTSSSSPARPRSSRRPSSGRTRTTPSSRWPGRTRATTRGCTSCWGAWSPSSSSGA